MSTTTTSSTKSLAKRYSRETIERGLRLYASGKSARHVARELGTSDTTIHRWVRNAGISHHFDKASKDLEKALAMYRNGAPMQQIRDETGVSETRVRRNARKRGIPSRNSQPDINEHGKVCAMCEKRFPLDHYYKRPDGRSYSYCRSCSTKRHYLWQLARTKQRDESKEYKVRKMVSVWSDTISSLEDAVELIELRMPDHPRLKGMKRQIADAKGLLLL